VGWRRSSAGAAQQVSDEGVVDALAAQSPFSLIIITKRSDFWQTLHRAWRALDVAAGITEFRHHDRRSPTPDLLGPLGSATALGRIGAADRS